MFERIYNFFHSQDKYSLLEERIDDILEENRKFRKQLAKLKLENETLALEVYRLNDYRNKYNQLLHNWLYLKKEYLKLSHRRNIVLPRLKEVNSRKSN